MIEVYRIGTKVKIAGDLKGVVTGIGIYSENQIQYRVAWWSGRKREEEWINRFEITWGEDRTTIGFAGGE